MNDTNGASNGIFNKLYNLNKNEALRTSQDNSHYDKEGVNYEKESYGDCAQEYSLSNKIINNSHQNHLNDDSVDVSNLISQYRLATSNSKLASTSSKEPNLVHESSNSNLSSFADASNKNNKSVNTNSEIQIL